MFKRCHNQNKNRLQHIVYTDEDDDDKVKVDWTNWGVFIASSSDGKTFDKVRHVSTGKDADISDLSIPTEGCKISANWDPTKAAIKWKRQTQNLFELFPKPAQKVIRDEMRREDLAQLSVVVKNELEKSPGSDAGDDESEAPALASTRKRKTTTGNSAMATPPSTVKRNKILGKKTS